VDVGLDYSTAHKRKALVLTCVALAFLVTLLYFRVLQAPFLYDDRNSITENEAVKNLSTAIRNVTANRYLGTLSFALNYSLHGLRPYGFHLFNIGTHIAVTISLFFLVRALLASPALEGTGRSSPGLPLAVSAMFAAHPVETQAVSYLSQRFVSLATLFYVLSILCYLYARMTDDGRGIAAERRHAVTRGAFLFLSLVCAAAAMKTKEIAVTLPVMLFISEWFFHGGSRKDRAVVIYFAMLVCIPVFFFGLPYGLIKSGQTFSSAIAVLESASKETANLTRAEYLLTELRVIITYLRLLVLPVNQNFDYMYPVFESFLVLTVLGSLCLLLGLLLLGVVTYRKHRIFSYGIVWFFVALSLESSVIPIRDVINEHRLYLPSIGIFLAGSDMLFRLIRPVRLQAGAFALIVLLLSAATIQRNETWRDPEKIWKDVVRKAPGNYRAINNLGVAYKEAEEYDKAIEQFHTALQLVPGYAPALYNLGDISYRTEDYSQALSHLTAALKNARDPDLRLDVLNKIGRTYSAVGNFDEAIRFFEEALNIRPFSFVIINNLGVQYIKSDRPQRAIELFEKALRIREDFAMLVNLSIAYDMLGDRTKSGQLKQRALEIRGH
jgi:tetratricopeptide (TPR) repeat protein